MILPKSVLAGGRTGPTLCWRAAESHHQSVQNWSCHVAASTVAGTLSFWLVSHGSRTLPCMWWCGYKKTSPALLWPLHESLHLMSSGVNADRGRETHPHWGLATRKFTMLQWICGSLKMDLVQGTEERVGPEKIGRWAQSGSLMWDSQIIYKNRKRKCVGWNCQSERIEPELGVILKSRI